MFTREHFEKIASVLSAARVTTVRIDNVGPTNRTLDKLANDFADIFAESNERFSKRAFIGACNAASRAEIRRLVQANNKKLADTEPTALQVALRDV